MIANPYNSPTDVPSPVPPWRTRVVHFVAIALRNSIVAAAFTGMVIGAIWLFYNGYPWLVSITSFLIFMVAALFAGGTWRERICLSLCVPFLVLGGYIGFQTYFVMFNLSWFESAFNSKDTGPMGLIIFVFGIGLVTAFGAAWSMNRISKRLTFFANSPKKAQPSEERQRTGG